MFGYRANPKEVRPRAHRFPHRCSGTQSPAVARSRGLITSASHGMPSEGKFPQSDFAGLLPSGHPVIFCRRTRLESMPTGATCIGVRADIRCERHRSAWTPKRVHRHHSPAIPQGGKPANNDSANPPSFGMPGLVLIMCVVCSCQSACDCVSHHRLGNSWVRRLSSSESPGNRSTIMHLQRLSPIFISMRMVGSRTVSTQTRIGLRIPVTHDIR